MSPIFPIGVATMYRPLTILSILFHIIFLFSCAPANYISNQGDPKEAIIEKPIINNTGDNCTAEKIKLICKLILRLQFLWIIIFVLIFFIISTLI